MTTGAIRSHNTSGLSKHVVRLLIASVIWVAATSTNAQILFYDDYNRSPVISLGPMDAEISRAKLEAAKAKEPALEFEMVKLAIKDYADRNRVNDYQNVSFASPERFRSWLRDAARRADISYYEAIDQIVQAVAPNPVPDLTGDVNDLKDAYLRERAIENVEANRAQQLANEEQPQAYDEELQEVEQPAAAPVARPTPRIYKGPPGDPSKIEIEFSDTQTTKTAKQSQRPKAVKRRPR